MKLFLNENNNFLFSSKIDVCAHVQCGPNAECVALNHVGACKCHTDYEGDPLSLSVGCRPKAIACSSSLQCPTNTYCYENICRREFLLFNFLILFSRGNLNNFCVCFLFLVNSFLPVTRGVQLVGRVPQRTMLGRL